MSTTPELLPILSHGSHTSPRSGACVMEYVSLLAGLPWSDHPACTHPVLAAAARQVNDRLGDGQRQQLLPLIPQLIGTADTRPDRLARQVLSVRLAVWCARQVLPLVDARHRAVFGRAVDAAAAWTDAPGQQTRQAAATAAAYAAAAYTAAATAAAYTAAATAAAYAAAAAAATAAAAYAAATDAVGDPVALLRGLIAEHARLTGHQPAAPATRQQRQQMVEATR